MTEPEDETSKEPTPSGPEPVRQGEPDLTRLPDISTPEEGKELIDLANWIASRRKRLDLSTVQLVRKFPGLGSDSTLGKICQGKLKELDVVTWLRKYRAVKASMEIIIGKSGRVEPIYREMSMAIMLENCYIDVLDEPTVARFGIGLADSGIGKSTAVRSLVKQYADTVKCFNAVSMWKDSPNRMLTALLGTFGEKNPPPVGHLLFGEALKKLKQASVCVVIDEAHHLGPECLNTIKEMINETPASFIALAMPTLWARMARPAYEEVKQLTGNRLKNRFEGQVEEGDVLIMLEEGLRWESSDIPRRVVSSLKDKATTKGNLRFVSAVISALELRVQGQPVSLSDYSEAVAAQEAKR